MLHTCTHTMHGNMESGLARWIHSSIFKVPGVDIVWKLIEANLFLCSGVENKLVQESVLRLPEILLIVFGHLPRLVLQGLDHLSEVRCVSYIY